MKKEIINFESVLKAAFAIPGVNVNREDFLREVFKNASTEQLDKIINLGPVEAGETEKTLKNIANSIINKRTAESTVLSFATGIPGGIALAATIPTDTAQFFAIAIRLAQELVFLYGADDVWEDGTSVDKDVQSRIVIYLGVMFGVTGTAQAVRIMTSAIGKAALKNLPKMALTRMFFWPAAKFIFKLFTGERLVKNVFAKGVAKAVPVIGAFTSGGITLVSMKKMGMRLAAELEKASFSYSEDDYKKDIEKVIEIYDLDKTILNTENEAEVTEEVHNDNKTKDVFNQIEKAKEFLDNGIITEEEFTEIKKRIINSI